MTYGTQYTQRGKRFLGVIPFFSAYGSFCGMHCSLCSAWNAILIPKFDPKKFVDMILKMKVNAALGVPQFWEQFLERKRYEDLSFLEIPVVGGDWISVQSVEAINAYFKSCHCKSFLKIGYGATEFSGPVAVTSDLKSIYQPQSVGIVLPANIVMVIDRETGEELSYDTIGELCISSPTMMKGYLYDDKKTVAITIEKNGVKYYKTGDLAKITKNGDILFCGRCKRVMMRPDGHTVACVPIENVICTNTAVKNCAVVGLRSNKSKSGVIPTAFIVLKDGTEGSMETARYIDRYCLQHLGERERALAITFVETLPYTRNGKVDFKKLEQVSFSDIRYFICEKTFFE